MTYLCLIKKDFELISPFYEGYEAVNILEDISMFYPLQSNNDHEGRFFNENRYWVKSDFEIIEIVNAWDSL